ncbi:hypothetical protein C6497_14490 [Candidatus Poribacteria bacterium]|nr:MAG: hypothetical protein C6497_14490 [Candidatus Poribacteria bacterium]
MKKRINPIFNVQWGQVIGFFVIYILLSIFDIHSIIGINEIILVISMGILHNIVRFIWNSKISGTIYGKVTYEKKDILSDVKSDIKITCGILDKKEHYSQAITNSKGEFRFDQNVPLGSKLRITANMGDQEITHTVDEIEGVRWLFGIKYFGLPISTGNSKRVDFTIQPE